jgi:WD40 repeat protein/predicted acylesterase/phospholipase RssA
VTCYATNMNTPREIALAEKLACLRAVPEFRGLSEEALTPLAKAMEMRVYPPPGGPGVLMGRLLGLVGNGDEHWITHPNRPVAERLLSVVVDGQVRLVQTQNGEPWSRALGPGTLFNEEGVAHALGMRGPEGMKIGAAPVGRAWVLELPKAKVESVLGRDPEQSAVLSGVLRGFVSAQYAPPVVQVMKRDPSLGNARLDDLYALAEGAEVVHLKRGAPVPYFEPGQVPQYFYVVVSGRLVSAPRGLPDPVAVGTRVDTAFPIGLSQMIRRQVLSEQLYAADDVTVMAIGADRFQELLYTNTDFFRAILEGAGVDPLRGQRDQQTDVDVVLVAASPKLETPIGPVTDLLGEAIASHMYDRTCVLHVLPPGEGPVPNTQRILAPHHDSRYPGATAVTHHYARADAEGVEAVDRVIEALREERAHDQDVAHDIILVDISRLESASTTLTRFAALKALTRICFVIDDPEDYVPFSMLLRSVEVVTVGVLPAFRDQRPIGLVMEEMHDHFQEQSVLSRVKQASSTVFGYGRTRLQRRAESAQRYAERLMRPWEYADGSPIAMPPWPPRTTRVRFDPELLEAVYARVNAPADAAPLKLGDWEASRDSINRWARGVTGRRVGIALGGGGAFGYVHAALIRRLRSDDYDVPIDLVSGSSFGAVVGAYYAGGDTDFERLIDHWYLMTAAVSVGIVTTASMTLAIDLDVGAYDMNEIEISYYPVVTDADTGTEWSLRRGTLGRGVRASGSLPPMAPTIEGVRRLLDGGLVANVPVQVLHDEGAGMIIASNPIPDPAPREPKAPLPIPFLGAFLRSSEPIDRIMDGFRSTLILMRAAGASQERFADLVYAAETRGTTMFRFQDRKQIMAEAERDPERRLDQAAERALLRWRRSLRRPPTRVQVLESGEIHVPAGLCFMERAGREVFTETAAEILGEVAAFLRASPQIRKVGVHIPIQSARGEEAVGPHRLAAGDTDADERASRVVEELTQRGVEPDRLQILKHGSARFTRGREVELIALEVATGIAAQRLVDAAQVQARVERRRRLTSDARAQLEAGNVGLARLLALEAAALGMDLEVDGVLRTILERPLSRRYALPALEDSIHRLRWSPDGNYLARAGSGAFSIHPHDTPDDAILVPANGYGTGLSWSPDQTKLARGSHDRTERIYDVSRLPQAPQQIAMRSTNTWRGWGVAFHPEGDRLLGTDQNGASIWTLPGTLDSVRLEHEGPINWAAWDADGKWVVTTGEDGRIGLWNAATGARVRWLHEGEAKPGIAAFNRDGVLAAADGRHVLLWTDPEQGDAKVLHGHHRSVVHIAWSTSGRRLATASDDLSVRLWNAAGELQTVVWGHSTPAQVLAWHPDHEVLASGGHDGRTNLWDGETGRSLLRIGGKSGVTSIDWRPQGDLLATGRADGTTQVWDPDSRASVTRRYAGEPASRVTVFPSDPSRVLTSTRDGRVEIWSSINGRPEQVLRESDGHAVEAALHPDASAVAFGREHRLTIVDLTTGEETVVDTPKGAVERIRWSPDGKYVAFTGDERCQVVDVQTRTVAFVSDDIGAITTVEWSPDSTRLLIGAWLAREPVHVWAFADGPRPVRLPLAHRDGVWKVAWSTDGTKIASGSNEDGTLAAARLDGTQIVGDIVYATHASAVLDVKWSPTGNLVATASGDRKVRVLDFDSGRAETIGEHDEAVFTVRWSDDGRHLVSGGGDAVARIWSVAERTPVAVIRGHENRVFGVGYLDRDKSLLTASDDGTIRVHLASSVDVRDAVAESASRLTMTPEEWAKWMPSGEPLRPSWPPGSSS